MVDRAPRGDKVVVLGDFNARVGNDVEEWNGVIGKQGEGVKKGYSGSVQIRIPTLSTKKFIRSLGSVLENGSINHTHVEEHVH